MAVIFIIHGIIIGIIISAPFGPVAVLCMQNTLQGRRRSGVITGLGAALADTIYATLAITGLTLGKQHVLLESAWVKAAIGAIILTFGIRVLKRPLKERTAQVHLRVMGGAFVEGFVLTIINPIAIIAMATLFAFMGTTASHPVWPVLGIFCGAMAWWSSLAFVVAKIHQKLDGNWIKRINRFFALTLLVLGSMAIADAAFQLL